MILPPFTLDGVLLVPPLPLLLLANKPRGILVTRLDPEGRSHIGELLRNTPWGSGSRGAIRPLGRLDMASAGVLLLTNFPELFSEFLDPSYKTPRSYRVQITPPLREKDRPLFLAGKAGEPLGYGRIGVEEEASNRRTGWLRIGLMEGKNREIRNFLEAYGYRVLHLIRTSFGPFALSGLPPGQVVDVTGRAGEVGVAWTQWQREGAQENVAGGMSGS
jgi:23S rRNA pseudouridine2605 synthase